MSRFVFTIALTILLLSSVAQLSLAQVTTTTTTAGPTPPPPPPAPKGPVVQSLYTEDQETFSSTVAMNLAAGMVSALSGNPVSVMFVLRTNMALSLCFPPTNERVSVLQLPFLLKVGPENYYAYYVGAAIVNTAGMVLLVALLVVFAKIMSTSKHYSMGHAFHNLHFPGYLFPVMILLGAPSCYCAAVVVTNASDLLNIVYGLVALLFWIMLAVMMPMFLAKIFSAEYIVTQNVQSEEQEKMLALTGKLSDATSSDRSSREGDDESSSGSEADGEEEAGGFSGFFSKLREGLEKMGDNTRESVDRRPKTVAEIEEEESMFTREELDQQEEDMKLLATSTVDVLREMFHHCSRTGGDEEKLLAALHGAGEWRDLKNDEDYLDDEMEMLQQQAAAEEEEGEEGAVAKEDVTKNSFLRRYGMFFEQYNRRNRFYGFVELAATYLCCITSGLWFFSSQSANCTFQAFSFLGIQAVMWFFLRKRRPFIARMNHTYSQTLIVMHFSAACCFSLGALFEVKPVILIGYIVGICSVYLNAFRALLDLYLVIVSRISSARENWPAIQELTDLFLAAKDRRDKGQMLTGPEMTNDKASARSGKSAMSTMSRRQTRFSQQFGNNGMQLFFKMATESDKFRASRAIPEEYHPFIMRPLPEPIVLVPDERRAAIREKMEKAAAKAKWEATIKAMTAEQEEEQARVSAAEAFNDNNFDEEEAEKKRLEAARKAEEEKSVPKLVRDLFQMGLHTKFDDADRKELEMAKIDDLLFPTESTRALKIKEVQSAHAAARKLVEAKRQKKSAADAAEAEAKSKADGQAEVDEAFAAWVRPDAEAMAQAELERKKAYATLAAEEAAADDNNTPAPSFKRSRGATMRAREQAIASARAQKMGASATEYPLDAENSGSAPPAQSGPADDDFEL